MSLQTPTVIRTLQRKLYRKAKERKLLHRRRLRPKLFSVCLTMKPVGEPDAGDRHVRFDERGWETERCRMVQVTAPILNSAIPSIRTSIASGAKRTLSACRKRIYEYTPFQRSRTGKLRSVHAALISNFNQNHGVFRPSGPI